jgi:amidohydrolase
MSTSSHYIDVGRRLWDAAEGGFHEWNTHRILTGEFEDAGFTVEPFEGIPGFTATYGSPGVRPIALITDMDALPLGGGTYRHMCGHHQQMTALVATALELRENAADLLDDVAFIAFPAEEYVDLDDRRALREDGRIAQLSGKQEMLERGLLSGYRAVIATHSAMLPSEPGVHSVLRMNGFDELRLTFRGTSAHAGAAPHMGRNAQNAASLFLQAAAFLRERFQEEDHIRIHPVLRLPPDQPVNFVPDTALIETYVRAATPDAVDETAQALVEAAEGCARAIGVDVDVDRQTGYMPLETNPTLHRLVGEAAGELGIPFEDEDFGAASTDVGDISQDIPAVIVGLPGTNAHFHRPDFQVLDEGVAYEFPARFLRTYLRKVARHLDEL